MTQADGWLVTSIKSNSLGCWDLTAERQDGSTMAIKNCRSRKKAIKAFKEWNGLNS